MPYTKHEFITGQQLSSRTLNEMDTQIENITRTAEAFTPEMVTDEMRRLTIVSEGDRVTLYYGDIELGSCSIGDLSNIIPCTALSVTSGSTLAVTAGQTAQIYTVVQPVDCNQTMHYMSSDMSIAEVRSNGQVVGKDAGRATIGVSCGRFALFVNVSVSKNLIPDSIRGNWIAWQNDAQNNPGVGIQQTGDTRYITLPYAGRSGIFLKAGQRLTVTPLNGNFWQIAIVVSAPVQDSLKWDDSPIVVGGTKLYEHENTTTHTTPFVYTATADCYVVMGFNVVEGCDTLADAVEAGYYSFVVDVPGGIA